MVQHTKIAERPEVVRAKPTELVLEVPVRPLERGVVLEGEALLVDAQEFVTPDHRAAVAAVVAIVEHAGVTNRDEREQALGAGQDATELVERMVLVPALECSENLTGGTSSSARRR
ncbi:hypothetical protein WMF04_07595 [Sorangium sp. So ce260]|uniref:hypothetical protein n=1 Tax=Sorangium sp. So ce260 TaxID=3133291 RepID=UPI003F608F98